MRRSFVRAQKGDGHRHVSACVNLCVYIRAHQLTGVSNVASSTLVLRSCNIEEGSVDRYKRTLQSESAIVTHEGVVVINIVIVVDSSENSPRGKIKRTETSVSIIGMIFLKLHCLGYLCKLFFRKETINSIIIRRIIPIVDPAFS